MTGGTVTSMFWAQVEPDWYRWSPSSLRGIKIRHITQRKPQHPAPGCVLIKLTVTLPAEAFVPRTLEGEVSVAPGQWEAVPATVEAEPLGATDG